MRNINLYKPTAPLQRRLTIKQTNHIDVSFIDIDDKYITEKDI